MAQGTDALEWFTKGVHYLSTVFSLTITVALLILVLGADKDHTQFFMTNSYLSTYSADNTIVTYTPVSDPVSASKIEETYYQCMYQSRVAMAPMYNYTSGPLADYKTFLGTVTSNALKAKKIATLAKKLMVDHAADVQSISQLPMILSAATLETDLLDQTKRNQLKLDLAMQSTAVAINILNVITQTEKGTSIAACVSSGMAMVKTFMETIFEPEMVLDMMWKCTSNTLYTEPVQKTAFEKCIPYTLWPARDVMQSVYSSTLLGAYNNFFFAIIGAWLMTSFAVYTFPLLEGKSTDNGKPAQMFARAGNFFVGFGFLWNLGSIIMVLVRGFTSGDGWQNFPMSVQTVLVSLFFTVAASIYFGREVYELMVRHGGRPTRASKVVPAGGGGEPDYSRQYEPGSVMYDEQNNPVGFAKRYHAGRVYHGINAFMRVSGQTEANLAPEQYIPLVVPVWSDAFFFVDGLLFLGIVGMYEDVVTADIVLVVFCILSASLVNSAVGRLLYEGYICEVPESNSNLFEKFKDRTQSSIIKHMRESKANASSTAVVLHSIQVMAFLSTITALLFSTMAFVVVVYRFGSDVPMLYVLFTSFLPQLLWVILALLIDSKFITSAYAFFNITSICFGISLLIRSSFLSLLATGVNTQYDLVIGKSDSLNTLLSYINYTPP
jgi:hypothetical protein